MQRRRIRDIRHDELINATISAVAARGYANVTMTEIATIAGSTAASINYYFGSKEKLMEATMRHLLSDLKASSARRLTEAETPIARLHAIIDANFDDAFFTPERCSVWVQFWASAPYSQSLSRLHRINRARISSHAYAEIRRIAPENASELTATLLAWIDGVWVDAAQSGETHPDKSRDAARRLLTQLIG